MRLWKNRDNPPPGPIAPSPGPNDTRSVAQAPDLCCAAVQFSFRSAKTRRRPWKRNSKSASRCLSSCQPIPPIQIYLPGHIYINSQPGIQHGDSSWATDLVESFCASKDNATSPIGLLWPFAQGRLIRAWPCDLLCTLRTTRILQGCGRVFPAGRAAGVAYNHRGFSPGRPLLCPTSR